MTLSHKRSSEFDRFLDGELHGDELAQFNLHLESCATCQKELQERRLFLEGIRAARPEQTAPPWLRARVSEILSTENPEEIPTHAAHLPKWKKLQSSTGRFWNLRFRTGLAFAISTAAVIAVTFLWIANATAVKATAFVQLAVDKHRQELAGSLRLQKQTDSPAELAGWFAKRVSFPFRLPDYKGAAGNVPAYKLLGGTLITVNRSDAAYVAYDMHGQLISLIVSARSKTAVGGGQITKEKGLEFHSHQANGLQIITWSVHDVSYALVASATMPSRESCIVCHSGPADRFLFKKAPVHERLSMAHRPHCLAALVLPPGGESE